MSNNPYLWYLYILVLIPEFVVRHILAIERVDGQTTAGQQERYRTQVRQGDSVANGLANKLSFTYVGVVWNTTWTSSWASLDLLHLVQSSNAQ